MTVTIYHNPRCSKSRQTLALIEEQGIIPTIREYLTDVPNKDEISEILKMLNLSPRDLMRKKENEYNENGLNNAALTDEELIQAMIHHSKLIERPIVINNGKAAIGRPPEIVLDIL